MAPADTTTAPAMSPAVVVDGLSKHFRLPHRRYTTLKERALHPLQSRQFDTLRAVDDVSVSIAPGRVLRDRRPQRLRQEHAAQVPGRDLRARRRRASSVDGRLSPFIELGVGFNPELTARDNVIINAIMLGLTRREARERFDDIIAFAELEEFVDLKLKNYSSGMQVRLAFSVADPGRRRHPPRRRGAGRRRRRVPAEVLRRVHGAEGRGPDDRLRHPRHERRRALLRPRDAASSAAASSQIGEPRGDRPGVQRAQLRRPRAQRRRARREAARRGDPRTAGSRRPTASR